MRDWGALVVPWMCDSDDSEGPPAQIKAYVENPDLDEVKPEGVVSHPMVE